MFGISQLALPQCILPILDSHFHCVSHARQNGVIGLPKQHFYNPKVKLISSSCLTWNISPLSGNSTFPGIVQRMNRFIKGKLPSLGRTGICCPVGDKTDSKCKDIYIQSSDGTPIPNSLGAGKGWSMSPMRYGHSLRWICSEYALINKLNGILFYLFFLSLSLVTILHTTTDLDNQTDQVPESHKASWGPAILLFKGQMTTYFEFLLKRRTHDMAFCSGFCFAS